MQIELTKDVVYRGGGDTDKVLPKGTHLQVLDTLVSDHFYFVCVLPDGYVKYIRASAGRIIDPHILETQKATAREVAARIFTDAINSADVMFSIAYLDFARDFARKAHEVAQIFLEESFKEADDGGQNKDV